MSSWNATNPWLLRAAAAVALLLPLVAAAGCQAASAEGVLPGEQLYRGCESCHGVAGEGDQAIGAPNIAGLPQWYVVRQLQHFRDGLRGKHPDDVEGLKMRPMSLQLRSEAEVEAVAGYVAGLTPVAPDSTLTDVDPATGQPFYTVCAACHGPQGQGNQDLSAPPIARLDDWYILRQLDKFKSGVRGRAGTDAPSLQMAGMAMTVPPDAVDDVAAYVGTLSGR